MPDNFKERDEAYNKRREIDLGTNKIILERDLYGMWVLHFERGQLPKMLEGAFTSYDEAKKVIDNYLLNKKREPKSVTPDTMKVA